ncbi:hypothetical protein [Bailinhaonella thermotolerans]|uniref:Hint domain-containing protein n=1 Tax=Bailinhaonella thermotolerans TaxID=1070861 RepID=A0A3A4AUW2_9ACTN|nr:hypothetical protein [Bailinhaonella thermotolerans]RJL34010.1 hypothetical protein D5H75_05665 [Bailinhaonella thermotolerans]
MKLVTRKEWGARPVTSPASRNISPGKGGVTIHYEGSKLGDYSHDRCPEIVRNIQRFHIKGRGWADIAYCADAETEILTENGWRAHSALREGDLVLTLNHETGLAEWQPVLEVCVFGARDREMISMEGAGHSSLTTPDHRWPVERPGRRAAGGTGAAGGPPEAACGLDRRWATTETLGHRDRIPIAAPCADLPAEPKWSDSFVELVAWFWTRGRLVPGGGRGADVTVRRAAGRPGDADRIRAALHGVFGPPTPGSPREETGGEGAGGEGTGGEPPWREAIDGREFVFRLSADAGAVLAEQAPDLVPRHDFLRRLTPAQLRLFIDTSLRACDAGHGRLARESRAAAEAFQFAAILAGMNASLTRRAPTGAHADGQWTVRVRNRSRLAPRPAPGFTVRRVAHRGEVWCPRTPNQTWLARRRGTVYFTGNTAMVCRHGYTFEGRWLGRRTAANGTTAGNDDWYAVCALMGDGDKVTPEMLAGIRSTVEYLWSKGARDRVNGHRDHISTSCPGGALYKWVRAGMPADGDGEEDDMPHILSLTAGRDQSVAAKATESVEWHVEYDDTGEDHGKDGSSISVGESRWAICDALVKIRDVKPGDRVDIAWTRLQRDADKVVDEPWRLSVVAGPNGRVEASIGGQFNLDEKVRGRLRVINGNDYAVVVEKITLAKVALFKR